MFTQNKKITAASIGFIFCVSLALQPLTYAAPDDVSIQIKYENTSTPVGTIDVAPTGTSVDMDIFLSVNTFPSTSYTFTFPSVMIPGFELTGVTVDNTYPGCENPGGTLTSHANDFVYDSDFSTIDCAKLVAHFQTNGAASGLHTIQSSLSDAGNPGVAFSVNNNAPITLSVADAVILTNAETSDNDHDGRIDRARLYFNQSFDQSAFDVANLSFSGRTGVAVTGGTGSAIDISFDPIGSGYDTDSTPFVSITNDYTSSGVTFWSGGVVALDKAWPVLVGGGSWATLRSTDSLQMIFSEPMHSNYIGSGVITQDSSLADISGNFSNISPTEWSFLPSGWIWPADGVYTTTFSTGAFDLANNAMVPWSFSFTASGSDTTPPIGEAIIDTFGSGTGVLIDHGKTYTTNPDGNVLLVFSGSDDSWAVSKMCVSTGALLEDANCPTGSGWINYANSNDPFSLGGTEWVRTVYVKFKDVADNFSPVYTDAIIWDKTPPTSTFSIDGGAFTGATESSSFGTWGLDLVLLADSDTTDIHYTLYLDSGTTVTGTGSFTGSWEILDFSWKIVFYAQDVAAQEVYSHTIIHDVDLVWPTGGTIAINNWATRTGTWVVSVSASGATDPHGPIVWRAFEIGGDATAWMPITNSGQIALSTWDGVKSITAEFKDNLWNISSPVTGTIILDTTPPSITLLGSTPITIAQGSTYTDSGATALDAVDGDITNRISTGGTFSGTSSVGSFTITYNVTDTAGNPAPQVTRTIHVTDQTNPTVTLLGSWAVSVELGSVYTDSGATWSDNVDGNGTIPTASSGSVNTSLLWTYTLDYTYVDAAGNPGNTVSRTVTVIDTTAPIVTLNGSSSVNVEFGSPYTELGATWSDIGNGTGVVSTISGSVDTGALGTYTLVYIKADPSGNTGSTTRDVTVIDTTAPSVTLNGSGSVNVEFGSPYTELGATWSDAVDGTGAILAASSGLVNTGSLGNYSLTYSHTDSSWNTGSVSRTVHVIDTTAPIITLNGSGSINIERGTAYTELWAIWSDPGYGTGAVSTISGSVNVNVTGTYSLTYTQVDPSGNTGSTTRSVTVADTIAPTLSGLTSTGITSTSGSLSFFSSETGTGYYIVALSGATAPSATDILAGLDGSGSAAFASGSFVTASGTNTIVISGLTPSTAYDIYITAKDLTGNLQVAPLATSIQTNTATDSIPNAFTFTPKTGAELNTQYTASMTVSGTDTGSLVSITGGEYQIGTGSFVTSTGIVQSGDVITVRGFSSPGYSTSTSVTLTISGVSGTFTITTKWAPSSGGGGGGGSYAPPAKDYCPNGDFSVSLYDGNCGVATASGVTNSGSTTPITSSNPWIPSTLSPLVARFVSRVTDPVRGISLFRTTDTAIAARMAVVESKVLNKLNSLIAEGKITPTEYQQAIAGYNQFVLYLTVYRETGSALAKSRALAGYETFIWFYRR